MIVDMCLLHQLWIRTCKVRSTKIEAVTRHVFRNMWDICRYIPLLKMKCMHHLSEWTLKIHFLDKKQDKQMRECAPWNKEYVVVGCWAHYMPAPTFQSGLTGWLAHGILTRRLSVRAISKWAFLPLSLSSLFKLIDPFFKLTFSLNI